MNSRRHAIGVDIGGTKIAIGLVTDSGEVLAARTIATQSRAGFPDGLARMTATIGSILRESRLPKEDLAGVGIGCAGPVDSRRGEIHNPHTLPGWEGAPVVYALGQQLDLPVWLENDADAAAIGECSFGAGRGADPVVMLTFGTGVGGTVILGGEILRGANGEHPEIGHIPISFEGPECYCGRAGCLESLLSGTALAMAGKEFALTDSQHVFATAAAGNKGASLILARATRVLEAAIWTVLHTYCPARIILGGGLVEAQPEFFNAASRAVCGRARLLGKTPVEVMPAQLGNRAGLIGAAAWALTRSARSRHTQPSAELLSSP